MSASTQAQARRQVQAVAAARPAFAVCVQCGRRVVTSPVVFTFCTCGSSERFA